MVKRVDDAAIDVETSELPISEVPEVKSDLQPVLPDLQSLESEQLPQLYYPYDRRVLGLRSRAVRLVAQHRLTPVWLVEKMNEPGYTRGDLDALEAELDCC